MATVDDRRRRGGEEGEEEEEEEEDDYSIRQSPEPDYENQDFRVDYDVDFTRKFLNVAHSYRVSPIVEDSSYISEFTKLKKFLQPKIEEYLEEHLSVKLHLTILAEFFKNHSDPVEYRQMHLDTKSRILLQTSNVAEELNEFFDIFVQKIHVKLNLSSDWVYQRLIHLDVLFLKFRPVRGLGYVALPSYLKPFRKSLTNIQNTDDHCLVLCVLAKLFPATGRGKNKSRPNQYRKYFNRLNITGLKQDYSVSDVELLEKNNPNLSINVYAPDEENQSIVGYRYSKRERKYENDDDDRRLVEIDLLLIHDEGEERGGGVRGTNVRYHYVLIDSLSYFVKLLHTKSKKADFFVCRRCLSSCTTLEGMREHKILCQSVGDAAQVASLPPEGTIYKFENIHKEIPLSFVGSLDWETYLVPIQGCEPAPLDDANAVYKRSYKWLRYNHEVAHLKRCSICNEESPCGILRPTKKEGRHVPYAFGLKIACYRKELHEFPLEIWYGEEDFLAEKFFHVAKKYCADIYAILHADNGVIMTDEDEINYEETRSCKYCARPFTKGAYGNGEEDDSNFRPWFHRGPIVRKVADHDHLTSEYRVGNIDHDMQMRLRDNERVIIFLSLSLFLRRPFAQIVTSDCVSKVS